MLDVSPSLVVPIPADPDATTVLLVFPVLVPKVPPIVSPCL